MERSLGQKGPAGAFRPRGPMAYGQWSTAYGPQLTLVFRGSVAPLRSIMPAGHYAEQGEQRSFPGRMARRAIISWELAVVCPKKRSEVRSWLAISLGPQGPKKASPNGDERASKGRVAPLTRTRTCDYCAHVRSVAKLRVT